MAQAYQDRKRGKVFVGGWVIFCFAALAAIAGGCSAPATEPPTRPADSSPHAAAPSVPSAPSEAVSEPMAAASAPNGDPTADRATGNTADAAAPDATPDAAPEASAGPAQPWAPTRCYPGSGDCVLPGDVRDISYTRITCAYAYPLVEPFAWPEVNGTKATSCVEVASVPGGTVPWSVTAVEWCCKS